MSTASERAWNQGWSVHPGLSNPAGEVIYREIKRWATEGKTYEDYDSGPDMCSDLDLIAWDDRLASMGLRGEGRRSESVHHGYAHEDPNGITLPDVDDDIDPFVNGLVNSYKRAFRDPLAGLLAAIRHADPDSSTDTGD